MLWSLVFMDGSLVRDQLTRISIGILTACHRCNDANGSRRGMFDLQYAKSENCRFMVIVASQPAPVRNLRT